LELNCCDSKSVIAKEENKYNTSANRNCVQGTNLHH